MAGLGPAIHVFGRPTKDVDTRDKPAQDDLDAILPDVNKILLWSSFSVSTVVARQYWLLVSMEALPESVDSRLILP